jgi:hypothetical protein
MGYVPKGAQKRLNAMAQVRANSTATLELMKIQTNAQVHKEAGGEGPRRLELGVTPTRICNAYDVYFDGKRQTLCTVADIDKGYIKRYVRGVGRKPVANKNGAFDMELLFGKVEIVPKGAKREARGLDGEDEGTTDSIGSDIPPA